MFVLPNSTAPAAANRSITCASYGLTKFASILEPQLVRIPRVQKMSLWAIGIPVSGPAWPCARFASAARASARLRSRSIVMKALSEPFSAAARARNTSVSSTLEMRFAARAKPSSARVALSKLLDDLRHKVEARFHRRGDFFLELFAPVRLGYLVVAQPLALG